MRHFPLTEFPEEEQPEDLRPSPVDLSEKKGMSWGTIAGIIILTCVVLAIIGAGTYCFRNGCELDNIGAIFGAVSSLSD